VAVGEAQHYGRASRRLRVAQPALSRQIQELEDELGFKLFDRLPRGVKLSTAGKLFLEDARHILELIRVECLGWTIRDEHIDILGVDRGASCQ
jgi:DNA-binding transcriptional LysR family regulator